MNNEGEIMNENNEKVTFELSDLSLEELVDSYEKILDFLKYLDDQLNEVSSSNKKEEANE